MPLGGQGSAAGPKGGSEGGGAERRTQTLKSRVCMRRGPCASHQELFLCLWPLRHPPVHRRFATELIADYNRPGEGGGQSDYESEYRKMPLMNTVTPNLFKKYPAYPRGVKEEDYHL